MQDRPDQELMRLIRGANSAALAELYDRYSSLVNGIGVRFLRDASEAEELVQDVFLGVWRQAWRFDPDRGAVQSWLAMVTRSRALDRVRSARVRRTRLEADDAVFDGALVRPRPESGQYHPVRNAERLGVHGPLAALPREQRLVLTMAYFEGLSKTEIAQSLGVPLGTVKSRTAAGLRTLRDLMLESP